MTKQITATTLERTRVKVGEEIWRPDPACPGLHVRISNSHTHTHTRGRMVAFYYRYKQNGRLKPVVIGEYPDMSLSDARGLVEHTLRPWARAGMDVRTELLKMRGKEAAGEAQTIRKLIPDYLTFCER